MINKILYILHRGARHPDIMYALKSLKIFAEFTLPPEVIKIINEVSFDKLLLHIPEIVRAAVGEYL